MALVLDDDRRGGTLLITDPGFRSSARALGWTEPGYYPARDARGRLTPESYVIRQDVIDRMARGAAENLGASLDCACTVLRAWEKPGCGVYAELSFDKVIK